MGIKTNSSGHKGKEVSELAAKETNAAKNNGKKKTRRRHGKKSLVQTLFDTCKELFANGGVGFVPSSEDIRRSCSILDNLKPSDVGLTPEMPYFRKKEAETTPTITYLHLHECEKFSMGIFCLPPSGVLPLHNHPGMTVFSKLLMGTMHIKSYDWATDISSSATSVGIGSQIKESTSMRLAKLKVNGEFTAPCDTSILYPNTGGNLHCFTAITPCAVLDVLTPPYSDPDGRHCAYYHEYPFENFSAEGITVEKEKESYSWLQERDRPKDLVVVGARYTGPKIVRT